MAHTLETVMKQLGDDAQLVGGRIIVFKDGKHTDVGGLGMSDAVFTLTEAGKALLDGEPAPKKADKGLSPAAKKADKKADKPAEDDLPSLDDLG